MPLWTSLVYSVNAFLLWGGGYWAQQGAGDFSGGYVIHLAAGVSGFVAAAMVGPRLKRDREKALPHNLPLVAIGAGIVWLGWNGFNGGDPYFASADAAAAVINTNMATAAALLTWVLWDMYLGPAKKPTFLGAVNGMVVGLVAITPCAGYVNGAGALLIGAIDSTIVWMAWTYLSTGQLHEEGGRRHGDRLHPRDRRLLRRYFAGGLCRPVRRGVHVREGVQGPVAITGALYGHPKQVLIQFLAAVTIILWDATFTFLILTVIKRVMPSHKLRMDDDILEVGDLAVHDEEGYPEPEGATRILPGYGEAMPVPAGAPRTAVAGTGGGG